MAEIPQPPTELSGEHLRFVLGLKLKSLRQEQGAPLKLVAARSGLSISYLSEIEKGKKYPTPEKLIAYESGVDPVGGGWSQSHVRYYLYGLLFVMFDVEAVFIFPWAVRLESLGTFALVEMVVFVVILALGLVYAWRKGVLRWA